MYALADCELVTDGNSLDKLIEQYITNIYNGTANMEQLNPSVYWHNVKALTKAIIEGYEKDYYSVNWSIKDTELMNRLQNNIYAFSGAKTYAEMVELRDAVYENGKQLSLSDFRRRARKINNTYNETYLEVERQQVIASATQGSRWVEFENTKDTHPYLEYCTARDSHVREEHKLLDGLIYPIDDAFWQRYNPPNGWKCRCFTRKLTEREAEHRTKAYNTRTSEPMPDSDQAQRIAGKVVPKQFRHNVGTTEVFTTDSHPYFKANADAKTHQLSAVKNYGMKSGKAIYNSDKKLAKYKHEINSKDDFNQYWDIMETHHGTPGQGFTLLDKRRKISASFDNAFKEKMISKGRYNYFDEVIDTFNTPDEIWGTFKGGKNKAFKEEYFNVYIKYYEDRPLVMLINPEGRVDSFYKLDTIEQVEQFRNGLLKKKR
ncbi:MAG: phage minor head protein [Marinifilaceae bacterium]